MGNGPPRASCAACWQHRKSKLVDARIRRNGVMTMSSPAVAALPG